MRSCTGNSLRRLSLLLGSVDQAAYKREVLFIPVTPPEDFHDAEVFRRGLDQFRTQTRSRDFH